VILNEDADYLGKSTCFKNFLLFLCLPLFVPSNLTSSARIFSIFFSTIAWTCAIWTAVKPISLRDPSLERSGPPGPCQSMILPFLRCFATFVLRKDHSICDSRV
jgi:hypothetical protein